MQNFQYIETNGIRLRVVLEGPEHGPLIILAHGFPESWFSWRHQIPVLASAGYRVAVPDMRGYGGSDQPEDISAYHIKEMTGDMAGLVEALSPDAPAIIIGHDWGAPISYNSCLLYPDHFRAVAGLSIPHAPVGGVSVLDVTKKAFIDKDIFFYLHYFQEPGVAEAEFSADLPTSIRTLYYAWSGDAPADFFPAKPANSKLFDKIGEVPKTMGDWFPPEVEAYYISEFERSGWSGALNRYRNIEADRQFLVQLDSQILNLPSVFIGGTRDPALIMFAGEVESRVRASMPNVASVHMLEGCGHWVQQERPEETNAILLDWLKGL